MIHLLQNRKMLLFELLFLFLLSTVPLLWFQPEHVVVGLDSGYAIDHVQYFKQRSYTWLASHRFGVDMSAEVGIVPYNSLPAMIKSLGVSQFDVQKILFVFWFFILATSMYLLMRYLFPKKEQWLPRLIGVIFYLFNLHIYSFWLQGEQPILASYAILPLFTLFLLRFVRQESSIIQTAAYLNIVYVLFSSGGMRGLPLLGPVIITSISIILYFLVLSNNRFAYSKNIVYLLVWSGIFFILCNAYFLLPFFSTFALQYSTQIANAGGISGAVDWAKFISTHTSFINLFRLHGDNNWYDKPYLWSNAYLTNPVLIVVSFLFPLFTFIAPLFVKDRKEKVLILFFALLALIGIFFSAGAHPPLGSFYIFMMERIPGFASFRSGYYKFIPIVYLSFSVLFATTMYYLTRRSPKFYPLLGILSIILILVYHYPFFSNNNFVFNKPFSSMVKIPENVTEFAKMKNRSSDEYRTLVVPPLADVYGVHAYTWGYWGGYPLFPLISDKSFIMRDSFAYDENENKVITRMYDTLRDEHLQSFLTIAKETNTKYILSTADFAKDYTLSLAENPATYTSVFSKHKDIFVPLWKNGPWEYYEIARVEPRKIKSYRSVTLNNSSSINGVLHADYFPFIAKDKDTTPLTIPVKGEFTNLSCISCDILNNTGGTIITPPRVIPTSFLYPLKLYMEKRNPRPADTKGKLYYLLGLSVKRASEFSIVNTDILESEDKWIHPAELLVGYWDEIADIYNRSLKNSSEYFVVKRVFQDLTIERDFVNNAIVNAELGNRSKLGSILRRMLNNTSKLDQELYTQLSIARWRNTFIFDTSSGIDTAYVNTTRLPKDNSGHPIMPLSYTIDGVGYTFPLQNNLHRSIPINRKGNNLQLNFNLPNLFATPEVKTIHVRREAKRCVASPIATYSGIKKYLITAKITNNKTNRGKIYIKRQFDVMNTQDTGSAKTSVFVPELELDIPSDTAKLFEYRFSGKANDTSAEIFFCTYERNDPMTIYQDITVTEVINPEVYTYAKKENSTGGIPQVSLTKKDPAHYTIHIRNAKDPYVLSFSERYSPLWDIYDGNTRLKTHFLINGYANGWYVDKDGTYDLILLFKTQRLLSLGSIISAISVVGLVIVIFRRGRRYEKSRE